MNYYAVKALQARAFLWYGEKENAYAAAMEVIEAKNSDGSKKFDIEAIKTAFPGQDFIIYPEQIFGLYDHQLDDKYSSFFQTGILYKGTSSQEIMKNLYGNTGKDFREQYLWELQRLVDGDRYTIKKTADWYGCIRPMEYLISRRGSGRYRTTLAHMDGQKKSISRQV